jgi:hypothetical protein
LYFTIQRLAHIAQDLASIWTLPGHIRLDYIQIPPLSFSRRKPNMASLIFAASYLTYNKIKTKREEKKEKKRKAYADRYHELEKEQTRDAGKQITQRQRTGESSRPDEPQSSPVHSPARHHDRRRRRSSESLRSEQEKVDGPTAWVDDVLREREGGGAQSPRLSGHQEVKMQSLV